ncbi:efflux transporter outer membrane subunit [Paraburkholderia silvatlantica]|uniref:NodT family efflux transporter outer membrane factor (OMF) lipoprotein n=1 Tax=Paraburkholderia silvatlantica TaxID=321895 RepID=A0ABR6FER8_9BURK|nr:efflux transporter outer membrane subunit [Paraburkholderia silvatlantica]MBB2925911.1 NodT family efflux transporter outer membrane factor (OMF) lipoprotein [Paraburkholderia silvatlantica]PVY33449.1 NodT family efflux transporter outer membrane factor (OMF) lipoprotein [Paraburkholderia silvatlantica]PXW38389.1 NodT family efflux transporter outer membrane factor (OMF) lipoprotein [Paraburkholderia silvatlantica]TDQ92841.1 NodT family efflux transporter outer membrane factor (OMF) lipoprot
MSLRRPLVPLALLTSVAALSACAVGPDYHRPDVPLAQRYVTPPPSARAAPAPAAGLSAWWEGFNDPLLTHYVSLALAQNLDLAQAVAQIDQARARLGTANAALLPSASVSASAARAYQSVDTPVGQLLNATPGYERWGTEYETNLEAGWEIDIFGGLRRQREAALADYSATQAAAVATRLAVAAQTADIYVTIRGLQARLDIANRQVQTQQALLADVTLLYSKGAAADYQVQQAQGALDQVQASVPVLDAALDAASNALDVMLGTPPGTHRAELSPPSSIPVAPSLADMGTPADLLQRRPDLIGAERHLAAANARIGAAISEYYPTVSLNAFLGSATSAAAGTLFSGGASQAAGLVGLRWRLFDFARINADVNEAKGADAQALAAYRQSVLRATEDVENSLSSLVNREAQAATLSHAESSLSKAKDSSMTAYRSGAASFIDVLHANETLLQAADARAQAQTESARAAISTFKALGGGWDPASLQTPTSLSSR